jgi:hypothetical protein
MGYLEELLKTVSVETGALLLFFEPEKITGRRWNTLTLKSRASFRSG